ncbi:RNA-binding protein, partial [Virgibacillus halodenitrificans]|nr:RNA-binding protein [Virgibacillus halodenitrificans]
MELYQHFRKEEQPFIDQVMSWKEDVEQKFEHKITDFLDPRE